jgi:hypothetical protein
MSRLSWLRSGRAAGQRASSSAVRSAVADADEAGKLPSEATHEIVEEHEGELPTDQAPSLQGVPTVG